MPFQSPGNDLYRRPSLDHPDHPVLLAGACSEIYTLPVRADHDRRPGNRNGHHRRGGRQKFAHHIAMPGSDPDIAPDRPRRQNDRAGPDAVESDAGIAFSGAGPKVDAPPVPADDPGIDAGAGIDGRRRGHLAAQISGHHIPGMVSDPDSGPVGPRFQNRACRSRRIAGDNGIPRSGARAQPDVRAVARDHIGGCSGGNAPPADLEIGSQHIAGQPVRRLDLVPDAALPGNGHDGSAGIAGQNLAVIGRRGPENQPASKNPSCFLLRQSRRKHQRQGQDEDQYPCRSLFHLALPPYPCSDSPDVMECNI